MRSSRLRPVSGANYIAPPLPPWLYHGRRESISLPYHTISTHFVQLSPAHYVQFSSVQPIIFKVQPIQFSSVLYALVLRLMLVGIWLGLHWVLFYFFDDYIQSSVLKPPAPKTVQLHFGATIGSI